MDDSKLKLDAAVKLEEVEVKTGEEDEDATFTMRSKVFVFIPEDVYGGEVRAFCTTPRQTAPSRRGLLHLCVAWQNLAGAFYHRAHT